jgi:hypothetical protein
MNHPHATPSLTSSPSTHHPASAHTCGRETAIGSKHRLVTLAQVLTHKMTQNITYLHLLTPTHGYQHLLTHKNECSKIAPSLSNLCPFPALRSADRNGVQKPSGSTQFNPIQPNSTIHPMPSPRPGTQSSPIKADSYLANACAAVGRPPLVPSTAWSNPIKADG